MKAPRKLPFLCLVLTVASLSSAAPPQNQPSDEAALVALITNYYAAYAKKDLGALVLFWSQRSPDLKAGIQETLQAFEGGVNGVSDVSVSQIKISDNKAILQVSAFFASSNSTTNTQSVEKRTRNFALIKDGSTWKIWRDADNTHDLSSFLEKGSEWKVSADSLEQFAGMLVNANEIERERLLAENRKMITTELRDALTRRAGALQFPSSYERAVSVLRLAQKISEQLGDKAGIAAAERQMGDAFREWGRWADALKHYLEAATLYGAIGRRIQRAAAWVSAGQVYFAQKNHKLAIETYEKALAEFESLNSTRAIADTLEELASVYYDQESYDRALEMFVKCLKLRETFAGKAEIAATLNSIGNVYFQRQEFDAAIKHYQKALAGFEWLNNSETNSIKDPDAVVSTMSNIASAEYSQASYEVALDYYLKALKLQDTLRDKRVAANIRLSIANIYSATGNYTVALEYLQQGLAVFEALREKNKIAGVLSDAGEAYFKLRNYNLALSNYQRSVQIFEELKSAADMSMRLYAIGNVHFFMSNFDLAIESYERALSQFESIKHAPGVASMFASIAGTRYAQQKYDLALEFYQKSLAQYESLGDKARAAGVIERIASVRYSKGEYAASLETVGRAIELAEQNANPDALWRARYTQGLALRATEKIEQAKESFQLSIATIEAMRGKLVHGEPDAQHFFQTKNAAYSAMMELLIAQNKVTDAFSYAERMRANSVSDIFQRAQITRSVTPDEAQQERKLERTVVAIKAQMAHEREKRQPNLERYAMMDLRLQKSIEDYRAFEAALYVAHPRLKTLRGEAAPQGLENAATLLSDSSIAFIEFVVTDTSTYLFALTRDSKSPAISRSRTPSFVLNAYVIRAGREELAARVKSIREMISQRDEKFHQTARETYELLFSAAREQLIGKTTLLIAPDDVLWQMPFAALRPSENRYLIEDRALAYAPSLSGLIEMMKPHSPTRTRAAPVPVMLALGNPVVGTQTAERLTRAGDRPSLESSPELETEVKSLSLVYGAGRTRVYIGTQATEELAKREADKFSMIHFAAPARFNDGSPLYSQITLAKSEDNSPEDGLLEARELMKLDLTADLIALSSSEPSQNRTSSGEGFVGVSWALFVAGCPTLAFSQWRVSAPSTTALMLEFYRSLKYPVRGESAPRRPLLEQAAPGGIGAARAMQQAMLKLLVSDEYKHPFFWAGFEVLGNGR